MFPFIFRDSLGYPLLTATLPLWWLSNNTDGSSSRYFYTIVHCCPPSSPTSNLLFPCPLRRPGLHLLYQPRPPPSIADRSPLLSTHFITLHNPLPFTPPILDLIRPDRLDPPLPLAFYRRLHPLSLPHLIRSGSRGGSCTDHQCVI